MKNTNQNPFHTVLLKQSILLLSLVVILSCKSSGRNQTDIILDERPDNQICVAGKSLPVEGVSIEAITLALPSSIIEGSVTVLKQNTQIDNSWYLVKQEGLIYKLDSLSDDSNTSIYLDLRREGFTETSNEQGVVGVAFHPDFKNIPQVFVFYTAASATSISGAEVRLSRFLEESGALNPASEEVLIRYDKDSTYHHSGTLEIGTDGYLYVSVGDDVLNGNWNLSDNAQSTFSIKGKILRIDVSGTSSYSIPPSNPYASGEDDAPEVFALGLRNPWRFSFDLETNALWLGDVGRVGAEEINKIEINNNYGWPNMEGHRCYTRNLCEEESYYSPYVSFSRNDKRCIIGGYVYRGEEIKELQGQY